MVWSETWKYISNKGELMGKKLKHLREKRKLVCRKWKKYTSKWRLFILNRLKKMTKWKKKPDMWCKWTKIFIPVVIFVLWGVCLVFMYADGVEKNIANSVVRLHILANSNSDEDQQLKLEVRDYLLGYMREDMVEEVLPPADVLSELAEEFVRSKGKDYTVRAEYCKTYFPTKEYNNVKFPAGQYNALRVLIGEGTGENWWCVMYPPLCMTNAYEGGLSEQSKEMLQGEMSEEGYALINAEKGTKFEMKFKVVEWYGEIKEYISEWWE